MKTYSLNDRMKRYEQSLKISLIPRSYTIIRVDGKNFSNYTSGLKRPFDLDFMADMDSTAIKLCEEIQGTKMAFVQSDEISIVITDFDTHETQAWFNNSLQKMCSVSASIATAQFNYFRMLRIQKIPNTSPAYFDSRVIQLPNRCEVVNYLIGRQNDTTRNSILTVARDNFSNSEMTGKSTNILQEMLFQKGINWNNMQPYFKRGRLVIKSGNLDSDSLNRNPCWYVTEPPIFSKNPNFLTNLIPDNI